MKKQITISDLTNKSKIHFSSENNFVDFLRLPTHIIIFFDDSINPGIDKFSDLHIIETNQPQTHVIEFDIPKNSKKARIEVSSDSYNVNSVSAIAV